MSYKFLGFALVTLLIVQVINVSYTANSYHSNLDYQLVIDQQEAESIKEEQKLEELKQKIITSQNLAKEKQAKELIILKEQKNNQTKTAKIEQEAKAKQKKLEEAKGEVAKKLEEAKKVEATKTAKTNLQPIPQATVSPTGQAITGSKEDWLLASGIPQSDWTYVDFIVKRESGWNPKALNKSSGACGLAQALPCAKTGCANYSDPVCALKWQYGYVKARYGGYAGAYNFWLKSNWY